MCVKGLTRRELGTAVGASAQISPYCCYNLLRPSSRHPFGLSPTPERQTMPFIPKGSEDLARRDCGSMTRLPLKESHGMWLSLLRGTLERSLLFKTSEMLWVISRPWSGRYVLHLGN